MLLALPPQTQPDTGSFPQDRDAVRTWLERLSPISVDDDAAELLRGLRHSNRLTNEAANRRLILEEFRPTLEQLITTLSETVTPQPLPMAAPFRQASALLDHRTSPPGRSCLSTVSPRAPGLFKGRSSNLRLS